MAPQQRIVVTEQILRVGRQAMSNGFLDSCDPEGLPWLLRSMDAEIAAQHRRMTAYWGWGKVIGRVVLTFAVIAAVVLFPCLLPH